MKAFGFAARFGGRTRTRTLDPLIKSQGLFESDQVLSQLKSVKPTTEDQWLSRVLSNRRWVIFSQLVVACAACGASPAPAADLPLEAPTYHHQYIQSRDRSQGLPRFRSFEDVVRDQQQRGYESLGGRVQTREAPQIWAPQAPTSQGERGRPSPRALATQAPTPTVSGPPAPDAFSVAVSKLIQLATTLALMLSLGAIIAGLVILVLHIPQVARAIDALFVPPSPPEPDPADAIAESVSAADIRSQTAALRALKEKLDAELAAAREMIRAERARHQQQPGKEDA